LPHAAQPATRPGQKPRFLPAATELMSEKAPQATFSNVLDAMNVSRLIPWICLSGLVAGCDGAPSRNILGSYFPSWMVCALVGIALALVARAVLKLTGLLEELPAPLVVLLALGCAVNFAMWLVWLA
jgi:hypothetical protein